MTYPQDLWFDIETLINVSQPARILLVGDAPRGFLDNYQEQKSIIGQACSLHRISSDKATSVLQLQEQFDVAIVVGVLEQQDKPVAAHILARLRDVLCPQFCLGLPIRSKSANSAWQLTDMYAFGLTQVALYGDESNRFGLFKYNITDYKKTPDWLNPDNWANPEMWGKYWW